MKEVNFQSRLGFKKRFCLKVSKSQKHFFLKFHCPKNKRNIRQNSALESKSGHNQKDKGPLLC